MHMHMHMHMNMHMHMRMRMHMHSTFRCGYRLHCTWVIVQAALGMVAGSVTYGCRGFTRFQGERPLRV